MFLPPAFCPMSRNEAAQLSAGPQGALLNHMSWPTLLGGCCASAREPCPATATAIAPPRNVLRFIESPSFCRCDQSFRLRRISARSLRMVGSGRDYLAPTGVGSFLADFFMIADG